MKRRGFLGVMAGAAVAGPGMAKQAAAKVAEELALGSGSSSLGLVGGQVYGNMMPPPSAVNSISEIARGKNMLDKLLGMSATQKAKLRSRMHVGRLDPDLANYRSMSIGFRMEMQRDRNLERQLSDRKTMWQRLADGLNPYEDEPL